MIAKILNWARPTLMELGLILILTKSLWSVLSGWDCLGISIIVLAFHAETIIHHKFPKRVDLYEEVMDIQDILKELKDKSDKAESEITALKFSGNVRAR